MHSRPVLSPADAERLRLLIHSKDFPRSRLGALMDFLSLAVVARHERETADRVALYHRVTMVSEVDERDWLKLTVVLPEDRNIREGRLSVLHDVSLAVLGRRCGEPVAWPAPPGLCRMRIATIAKPDASVRGSVPDFT